MTRITCLVPGCHRTTPRGRYDQWICGKHWPLVPRDLRRAYARAKRRRKPASALSRLWVRCEREAIAANFMRIT